MTGTKKSGRRDHSLGKRAGRKPAHLARNGYVGQSVFVQILEEDGTPQPLRRGEVVAVAGGRGEPRSFTVIADDLTLTITFIPCANLRARRMGK